jgi:hypothetical protein
LKKKWRKKNNGELKKNGEKKNRVLKKNLRIDEKKIGESKKKILN